jgi:hypothetical protein
VSAGERVIDVADSPDVLGKVMAQNNMASANAST